MCEQFFDMIVGQRRGSDACFNTRASRLKELKALSGVYKVSDSRQLIW